MSVELEEYAPPPKPPSTNGRAKRGLLTAAVIIAMFVVAYVGVKWLGAAVRDAISPTQDSVVAGESVTFEVVPGESAAQIARELAALGVVASASEFDRVVREASASDRLQAGTYQLQTGMAPSAVLDILLAGPAAGGVYRLTVVEGLTVAQMLESISRQTDIPLEDLTAPLLDGTVTSTLMPATPTTVQHWEGLLFPDTYEFRRGATAVDILSRMATTAEERVGAVDWTYLTDRGLTPYHGIIIASLIEREVVLDEERPLVASVVFNRLDIEMMLQIDATVIYALGGPPDGGLSLADLDVDSPYNTYRNHGLPPTPIAGVRAASLEAAAHPADTVYLFYLLTGEDGSHSFTDDFDEFLRWQQEGVD